MGSRLWEASSTHPAKVETSSPPPHNIIFLVASLILKLIKHGMCCNPVNIKLGMCKESRTPRHNCITTLISSLYLKSLCVQVPSSQDYYKLSSNSHITFITTTTITSLKWLINWTSLFCSILLSLYKYLHLFYFGCLFIFYAIEDI